MRAIWKCAISAMIVLLVATPAAAHVPDECLVWLQEAGETMTRLGQKTAAMRDAMDLYHAEGEIWLYADLTNQAMGTAYHGYLVLLEGFECSHPGLIPPEALDALRAPTSPPD